MELTWAGDKLNVAVTGIKQRAAVLLAITETDLTTNVARGENGGRVLHHAAVVRKLIRLGEAKDGTFSSATTVTPDSSWKPDSVKVVVFVQDERTGAVIGAQAIALSKQPRTSL